MTNKQIAFCLLTQIVKSYARFCAKKIFDSSNPNIYHTNATLGGGVLGGSIAGLEYDENGNATGFSPQNFALGFASGALASKGLQTSAKRLEKLAKTNPRAKELLEKIHIKNDIIPSLSKGEQVSEKELIKALESSPQKGQEMLIIGKHNISEGILEWAKNNNKKIAIDILPEARAKELGFKYPKVKRTISASEINHTLRRHGKNSHFVKKGMQEPVTLEKIKNFTEYADNADYHTIEKDNLGIDVLLSGKQINGYYVIIESVRKGANELAFKTMYFEKGDILKHKNFKQFKK
ncbi:PBECR3 domain-containing polyvalent protein [Helicobacter sp. T3_23-1056]